MKKEDIKSYKDYSIFWKQERKRYDNGEIEKEEFSNILQEAIKIVEVEERKEYLKNNKDILCNNCGASLLEFWDGPNNTGLRDCRIRGGYFSKVLYDLVEYKFNLCEKCLKEMFDKFKIPVIEEEYDPMEWINELSKNEKKYF